MLARAFGVALGLAALFSPWPGRSQGLAGASFFRNPPWTVDLISYYMNVWDSQPEYYFTVELPADAGAPLGQLTIQQTRGSDWQFPFYVEPTSAFLGRPRAEGRKLPLSVQFDQDSRRFQIRFDPPVPPGSTVTTVLKPWNNPDQADVYLFKVTAWPAGPDPIPAALGYGTLRIYATGGGVF